MLATMVIALIIYPLFFHRPKNIQLLIVLTPLALIIAPMLASIIYDNFINANGGSIRISAFNTALRHLPDIFMVGAGEDSAYGSSYQMLFGANFYPSDLGLIGLTFKYGLIGLILYLYLHSLVIVELCKAHWKNAADNSNEASLIWAFLIFFLALTFSLLINAGLANVQGITLGSCALALAKVNQVRS
jgi:O-antigen ligase